MTEGENSSLKYTNAALVVNNWTSFFYAAKLLESKLFNYITRKKKKARTFWWMKRNLIYDVGNNDLNEISPVWVSPPLHTKAVSVTFHTLELQTKLPSNSSVTRLIWKPVIYTQIWQYLSVTAENKRSTYLAQT